MDRPFPRNTVWRICHWPLLIAATSIAGLLPALLGDGWADALSWLLLCAVPLGVLLLYHKSKGAG